jgi:hypothetical protein
MGKRRIRYATVGDAIPKDWPAGWPFPPAGSMPPGWPRVMTEPLPIHIEWSLDQETGLPSVWVHDEELQDSDELMGELFELIPVAEGTRIRWKGDSKWSDRAIVPIVVQPCIGKDPWFGAVIDVELTVPCDLRCRIFGMEYGPETMVDLFLWAD